MKKEQEKFARKCDHCDKLFNEGYCLNGGERYYCSDDCLFKAEGKNAHEDFAIGDDDSESYWTVWEDDFQYYEDGTEVEQ